MSGVSYLNTVVQSRVGAGLKQRVGPDGGLLTCEITNARLEIILVMDRVALWRMGGLNDLKDNIINFHVSLDPA